MVTLPRPKPIIAQTYPRTYTRDIQLFESDVYTPTPHHRESASVSIRIYGGQSSRANNTEPWAVARDGVFRTYSPPLLILQYVQINDWAEITRSNAPLTLQLFICTYPRIIALRDARGWWGSNPSHYIYARLYHDWCITLIKDNNA